MIKAICYNYNLRSDKNTSFKSAQDMLMKPAVSIKTKRLLKKVTESLAEEIVNLRKKKAVPGKYLNITKTHPKTKAEVSLTPLYNDSRDGSFLIEVKRFDSTEVIDINRRHPEQFRYEKRIPTPTGYATTRTFDTRTERNEMVEEKVDMILQEYLPLFLKKKPSIHDHIV